MGDNIYDNKFEKLAEISEFLDCLSSSEIILLLLNKTLVKNITIYATSGQTVAETATLFQGDCQRTDVVETARTANTQFFPFLSLP